MKRDTENLDPRGMLAHFDRAKREVQAAASLAAAKTYRDKAKAVQSYAKLAKDRELLERATDLQLSAERRMGELLAEMEATGEKAKRGKPAKMSKATTFTELGITRDEGARAKRLAEPPAEVFEQALTDAKKLGQLTHAAVIKHATPSARRNASACRAHGRSGGTGPTARSQRHPHGLTGCRMAPTSSTRWPWPAAPITMSLAPSATAPTHPQPTCAQR